MNTQGPTLAVRPNEKERMMEIWGPWIEWAGGECPIPLGTVHEIRGCDGSIACYICDEMDSDDALGLWRHEGDEGDITAYRTQVRLEDLIGKRVEVEWSDPKCDWPHFVLEAALSNGVLRLQGRSIPGARYEGGPEYARPEEILSISAVADEPETNTCAPLILQGSLYAPARVHVGTWEPAKPEEPKPAPSRSEMLREAVNKMGKEFDRDMKWWQEWFVRNVVAEASAEPTKPEGVMRSDEPGIEDERKRQDYFAAACPVQDWEPTREAPSLPVAGFDHRLGMWK